MNSGSLVWLIIFFISTAVFFIIAAVVSWFGAKDLKYLLTKTEKHETGIEDKK